MWRAVRRHGVQRADAQHNELSAEKWIAEVGIKKNITFHCFRHTYTTLQIASGTDIYKILKMLTP